MERALEVAHKPTELEELFMQATYKSDVETFRQCLAKKVDCNMASNEWGYTPLHNICISGRYTLLDLILKEPGINVNQAEAGGLTPLHYAAIHFELYSPEKHYQMLIKLIKKGAIVNAPDKKGITPLSELLNSRFQYSWLAECLIDHGADVSIVVNGETIFEKAIRTGNPEHIKAFLKANKGINKPVIMKSLILAKKGFLDPQWGFSLWFNGVFNSSDLAQGKKRFAQIGRILLRYYYTMQNLGFEHSEVHERMDWHRSANSIPVPTEIGKLIAYHAARQQE